MKKLLMATLILSGLALAQSLKLEGGWVRLVPGPNLSAYFTLYNPGPVPIKIVGASSPVAKAASLHQTMTKSSGGMDMTSMDEVKFLTVPAKSRLVLKPQSYHVMLENVTRSLKIGDKVTLVLRLEGGKTLSLQLPVEMR